MMKRIVIDLDNTLTIESNLDYENKLPNLEVIQTLRNYKSNGFEIVIFTARNMKTHQNNLSKITAVTLPIIFRWLDKHQVPYDEIMVGKPWCGEQGFYVDDKAIRPSEFIKLSLEEIEKLIN